LTGVIRRARDERPIQRHLEAHPHLLVNHLGGGHGRWAIPQKRLGAEYVPDFLLAECSSIGMEWEAVELESPLARIWKRDGDFTQQVNHAVEQIRHWRLWLSQNRDYAARARSEGGLGLTDIDGGEMSGLVLIGRRDDDQEPKVDLRRQRSGSRIIVHTYDWLIEWLSILGEFLPPRPSPARTRGARRRPLQR
jgi:hypothetical protein